MNVSLQLLFVCLFVHICGGLVIVVLIGVLVSLLLLSVRPMEIKSS